MSEDVSYFSLAGAGEDALCSALVSSCGCLCWTPTDCEGKGGRPAGLESVHVLAGRVPFVSSCLAPPCDRAQTHTSFKYLFPSRTLWGILHNMSEYKPPVEVHYGLHEGVVSCIRGNCRQRPGLRVRTLDSSIRGRTCAITRSEPGKEK